MSVTGSTLLGTGVGSFIGFLLAQGFTKLVSRSEGGFSVLTGLTPDGKPFNVKIQNPTLANPQYDLVKLSTGTTITKKTDKAQYEITNTASGDKRIYTIGIVPDATFKTDGVLEIRLNGVRLFPISDPAQGMLENVSSLNIPIPANYGLSIKESDKLEVFIWNPNAANATVNFAVFIANVR